MDFEDFDGLKRPHASHGDVKRLLYLWRLFCLSFSLFLQLELCNMLSACDLSVGDNQSGQFVDDT